MADGFYEWKKAPGGKQPWYFQLQGGHPFGFAGLWDRWKRPDGEPLESCVILTTDANEVVRPIHERMPVILAPEAHGRWMEPVAADDLRSFLGPFPAAAMESWPVSKFVNNPRNEGPGWIEPAVGGGQVAERRGKNK